MRVLAEVLLGDLQLKRQRRLGHATEQGVEGLAGLEIEGPVLRLYQNVARELPIQRLELIVSLTDTIHGAVLGIDEGAPHHDATV